jgi:hypothetical protein
MVRGNHIIGWPSVHNLLDLLGNHVEGIEDIIEIPYKSAKLLMKATADSIL